MRVSLHSFAGSSKVKSKLLISLLRLKLRFLALLEMHYDEDKNFVMAIYQY